MRNSNNNNKQVIIISRIICREIDTRNLIHMVFTTPRNEEKRHLS